jgi:16S rRNA (cytosine967-C5)-methyltransferase
MNARAVAARVLQRVLRDGVNLDVAYTDVITHAIDPRERSLIKEICYGVLRWYHRLDFFLNRLIDKPLKPKDIDIQAVLLVGLYQLGFMRTPVHAAVSATVESVIDLNKPWAKPLINAVLRRYHRESSSLEREMRNSESAFYSHPMWLISAIRYNWPQHWEQILIADNKKPPMFLRVNVLKKRRDEYLRDLAAADIEAVPVNGSNCGLKLMEPVDVDALPGFDQGWVSIQDIGAQYAATLLDLTPGLRVLDACAAPGGKCTHILEAQPALACLTAIDIDEKRLQRLIDNCRRLELKPDIIHADAEMVMTWWNCVNYDRILLDVPCSATGVIRRHPDIKLQRREDSIGNYTDRQRRLLESNWSMLDRAGRLVYVTCSILSMENDLQIEKFLECYPDARVVDIIGDWGLKTRYGRQTLPGIGEADGFYYAVVEKR